MSKIRAPLKSDKPITGMPVKVRNGVVTEREMHAPLHAAKEQDGAADAEAEAGLETEGGEMDSVLDGPNCLERGPASETEAGFSAAEEDEGIDKHFHAH